MLVPRDVDPCAPPDSLPLCPAGAEQLGTDKVRGAVRFRIGPFNTKEHIQTAIEAVRDIAGPSRNISSGRSGKWGIVVAALKKHERKPSQTRGLPFLSGKILYNEDPH